MREFLIVGIEIDGRARKGLQFLSARDVIDMSVGDDNRLNGELVFLKRGGNAADFIPGIDHDGLASGFISQDGAIALEKANRQDDVDHAGFQYIDPLKSERWVRRGLPFILKQEPRLMDITDAFLHTSMRFLHIGSVVALVGSAIYGRLVLTPVLNTLPEPERLRAASDAQGRFRTVAYVLLAVLVGAGLYNLLTGPRHSSAWQMWFGIKMLAVLHFLATSVLWAVSPYGDAVVGGKGKRRLASLAISGLVAILISSYLRYLTQHGG